MQLSVIIPVLNEEATLPALLTCLSWQTGVEFEVLVVDGGSTDSSCQRVNALAAKVPYRLRLLASRPGRGHQLNVGAAAAEGDCLLFLHADSLFAASDALLKGLSTLASKTAAPVAARFSLHFRLSDQSPPSFGYYFYESKAHLDRRGSVHGDQGLLVNRPAWDLCGPFDTHLPLAEDTFFADRVRALCGWRLVPVQISTSARRFEAEGLKARQTLNALLLNFLAIGWDEFFRAAPAVYRQQDDTRHLELLPWWQLISGLQSAAAWQLRWARWWRTGRYVRGNAWQLALLLDAWRNFRHGVAAGEGATPCLRLFGIVVRPLLANPLATGAAALLTRIWFAVTGWRLARRKPAMPSLQE